MKNTNALLTCAAGFISAIFAGSFFSFGLAFLAFLIFLSAILFLFGRYFASDPREKRKISFICLFLLFFAIGIGRYEMTYTAPDQNLENSVGDKVALAGIISEEPQSKESGQMLTIDLKTLATTSATVAVSGRILVSAGLYPAFHYGDEVNIYGILETPKNFPASASSSDNSIQTKDFDYVAYLAKDNIGYTMDFANVSFLSGGHGDPLKTILLKIKDAFTENTDRVISQPEASLLSGILLGAKSSIDAATSNAFRIAGLSHIVALSGYNITIVAEAIMAALSFLPRTFSLSTGVIGIILFVIMSGSSSTAVRAGIMALIVILAQVTRRNYEAGRALIVAALLMMLVNPRILVFDISFQLSFLATIAIIYVAPILKSRFAWITERYGLRDIISSTIAAQVLVLPLILYTMGQLSLVALPANILVLAFIPAAMFFGFATGMAGFIWLPLSLPFAWITYVLLAYMIFVAQSLASLPFSSIFISWFSPTLMFLCYAAIAVWIMYERKKQK